MVDQTISLLHPPDAALIDVAHGGGNAMLHDRSWLVKDRETSLPRAIANIDILPIDRSEQGVKSSDLEEPPAIEHCRAATREHRVTQSLFRRFHSRFRCDLGHNDIAAMNANKAAGKAPYLTASTFPSTFEIEDSTVRGKHRSIGEVLDEGRDRVQIDVNIIVEKEHQRVAGGLEPPITCRAEPAVR